MAVHVDVLKFLAKYTNAGTPVRVSYDNFVAQGTIVRQIGQLPVGERLKIVGEATPGHVRTALFEVQLDNTISYSLDFVPKISWRGGQGDPGAAILNHKEDLIRLGLLDGDTMYGLVVPFHSVEVSTPYKGQLVEYTTRHWEVSSLKFYAGIVADVYTPKVPEYPGASKIAAVYVFEPTPYRTLPRGVDRDELMLHPAYFSKETNVIGRNTYEIWKEAEPTRVPQATFDPRANLYILDHYVPLADIKRICTSFVEKLKADLAVEDENHLRDQFEGCMADAMMLYVVPFDMADQDGTLRPMRNETAWYYYVGYAQMGWGGEYTGLKAKAAPGKKLKVIDPKTGKPVEGEEHQTYENNRYWPRMRGNRRGR